jgi:hypothetical protein
VGGAGFLLGRGTAEPPPLVIAPPVAAPAPKPEPALSGVLGRGELIALAAAAADAAAGGTGSRAQVARADGRRFELRLAFGCDGPADADSKAPMRWRYDAKREALRVHVAPVTWSPADWGVGGAGPRTIEGIEGFWIARPWTSSEACPARAEVPAAPAVPEEGSESDSKSGSKVDAKPVPQPATETETPPEQTLALGQPAFAGGARDSRRNGGAYETVVRVSEGELDASQGFRLRISGRIARLPGEEPVLCRQPAGSGQRPACLLSVVMDEVAIENPATGATLATWTVSGRNVPDGLRRKAAAPNGT